MGTLEDGGEYHLYIGIWCTAGVGNNQCFPVWCNGYPERPDNLSNPELGQIEEPE